MARHSRFKHSREEASRGHEAIGDIIREVFPLCKVYQEYPMDLILKRGYKMFGVEDRFQDTIMIKRARSLKADWVILDRNLIVEYHGEHHYSPVDYGDGKGAEAFERRQHLDRVKRLIAKEANFDLIEWPHYEELTLETFKQRLDEVK